jgi:hypothetical protein
MAKLDSTKALFSGFLMLLLCVADVSFAAQPDRTRILKQMVEQYGGSSALKKLNAPYSQHWDLMAMTRNEKGTDHRTISLPQNLTVELTYPSKSEKRVLLGDSGEKVYDQSRHVSARGPGLMAMKLQRMRLYNPLLLQQRAAEIDVAEADGGYYKLTLREGTLTTVYYVNQQTMLIDRVTGTLTINGASMTFLTEYSDYKPVEGVMLPHKEIKYAGKVNTAVLTLRETHFGG